MADEQIVTNIVANADFSNLIGDLNKVTAALTRMQAGLKSTDRALANQIRAVNTQFGETLRSTGQFTSHFVTISSDVEKFGKSLDSGKMKLGQYFKVWQDHNRTAGGLIRDLAKQQVQMQNAVLQPLGKNAEGMMRFAVHVPRGLDEIRNKTSLTRQELAIMNKVVQDGAGQLINWGKNTQWAGRQLTVGLTIPLVAFGKASADAFKAADEQLVRLTKVYGDLGGASAETLARVRKDVSDTARQLSTTMGVNFKDTIALAADIAATGKTGNELLGSISETTRLAVLGEVDRQEAMKATLAIQSTFKQNTEQLAESINFLNAVENQTSTTLNDLVEAIPRAGTVVQGLGGSVQDLALYLTAMREGGVNAAEGANAIKSSLASLINPTKVATAMFADFGIDLRAIVTENAGNLTKTILGLQSALETLDPLQKQQALEQLFGKFQFARLNALFSNLGKQGSQTLQILDLMKASSQDLADIAGRELSQVTESASGKYKRAIETLKADLAKTGEQFLGIATKVVNSLDKIITFINNLPDPIKKIFGLAGAFTAVVGPVIMLTGVLGNFFGYIVKGIYHFKALFKGAEGWKLLTPEIMAANNAGTLIEKTFYSDAQAAGILQKAILDLTASYEGLGAAANRAAVGTGAISTVAGNYVAGGGIPREVDPKHPLAGAYQSRAFAHMVPRKIDQPGTIFGVTQSAGPVNSLLGENPMIYATGDMPVIPGLTAVQRTIKTPTGRAPITVSTGVVADEVAKNHAMMAALAMQSKDELRILQNTLDNTGALTTDFMGTFDDILPITTRLAQKAANESAEIVAQVQAGKMSIAAARDRIIQLNILIEQEMARDVSVLAASRGAVFDPYTVPTSTQPSVDPITGKTNMKELFHKAEKRSFLTRIADRLRVRTSGAGYNIETTRPIIRRQTGGTIPYTLNDGPIVPGPSSDTTDTQFGMLPAGTYIVNKEATANNIDFLSSLVGTARPMAGGGSLQPVMLTPEEFAVDPEIVNQGNNFQTLEDINSGRIVLRKIGGLIPRIQKFAAINPIRRVGLKNPLKFVGTKKQIKKLDSSWTGGKDAAAGTTWNAKPPTGVYGVGVGSGLNERLAKGTASPSELLNSLKQYAKGKNSKRNVIGTTDEFVETLVNGGIITRKEANDILDDLSVNYANAVSKMSSVGDDTNPYYQISRNAIENSTSRDSILPWWNAFQKTFSSIDKNRPSGSDSGASSSPRNIKIKVGNRTLTVKKFEGSKKDNTIALHSANPDWANWVAANSGGRIRGYNTGGLVGGKKIPGMQYKNLGGILRALWTTITGALRGRSAVNPALAPTPAAFNIPFQAPGEGLPISPTSVVSGVAGAAGDGPVAKLPMFMGMGSQALGIAGSIGGSMAGQNFGPVGMMVGSSLGYMAMFLPQLIKAARVAGGLAKILKSITIPGIVITTLIGIGKLLLDAKKRAEDLGKANRLAFGGTKESFASVGIKSYTSIKDRIKSINDELELHKAKVKSVYQSYTKTGVAGLSLTIEQLREAVEKARKEQKEYVEAFDNIDPSRVVAYAAQLKAQFIAMGMSAQDATNQIYAIVKASDKASQAFSAITSKDFNSIQTTLDGIKFVIDYLGKSTGDTFNSEEFNRGLDTLLNSVLNYRDSLIGAKDEQKNIRDEADATAETLEKISKIKGAQSKLNEEQIDQLKSQNIVYAGILGNAETLESITAKILLYAGGLAEIVNLGAMGADAAIALAKNFADVQNIMNSVTEDTDPNDKFRNSISPLSVEIARLKTEAGNAAAAVKRLKKVDEDYYREKMKAIDKLIAKLQKERDERLKLIDTQEKAFTFENQMQNAQIKYQQALTAGNLAQAAQEQLNIKQLSSDRQREILRTAIADKYNDEIEKLQAEKDKLQEELDNANKNAAAKTAAAADKAATLAQAQAYRDELEMIALRSINKPLSSTDSMRIENIFKEMEDAGGYLRKVGREMRKANPATPDVATGSTFIKGKSFSQTLVDNLNADLRSRAAQNKTFSDAVNNFVAAVNKFAGTTQKPLDDKLIKGFKPPGAAGGVVYQTSVKDLENSDIAPVEGAQFPTTGGKRYEITNVTGDRVTLKKLASGGQVQYYGPGGKVKGPGTPTSDDILIRASQGEFMINANSVANAGVDNMHLINQKGADGIVEAASRLLNGYAKGGMPKKRSMTQGYDQALDYFRMLGDLSVNFQTDKSTLQDSEIRELQLIAAKIASAPGFRKTFLVKGYADRRGSRDYNMALSKRRAETVSAILSELLPGTTFIPVAEGEYGKSFDSVDMSKKRRVSIELPSQSGGIGLPAEPRDTLGSVPFKGLFGGGVGFGGMLTMAKGGHIPGFSMGGEILRKLGKAAINKFKDFIPAIGDKVKNASSAISRTFDNTMEYLGLTNKSFDDPFGDTLAKSSIHDAIDRVTKTIGVIPQKPNDARQAIYLAKMYRDHSRFWKRQAGKYKNSKETVGEYNAGMQEMKKISGSGSTTRREAIEKDWKDFVANVEPDDFTKYKDRDPSRRFLDDEFYKIVNNPEVGVQGQTSGFGTWDSPGLNAPDLFSGIAGPENISVYDAYMAKFAENELIYQVYKDLVKIIKTDPLLARKLGFMNPRGFAFGGLMGLSKYDKGGKVKSRSFLDRIDSALGGLADKKNWEQTSNFFGLPSMGKTAQDFMNYGNPVSMLAARAMGAPMKSSLGDNVFTGLAFLPYSKIPGVAQIGSKLKSGFANFGTTADQKITSALSKLSSSKPALPSAAVPKTPNLGKIHKDFVRAHPQEKSFINYLLSRGVDPDEVARQLALRRGGLDFRARKRGLDKPDPWATTTPSQIAAREAKAAADQAAFEDAMLLYPFKKGEKYFDDKVARNREMFPSKKTPVTSAKGMNQDIPINQLRTDDQVAGSYVGPIMDILKKIGISGSYSYDDLVSYIIARQAQRGSVLTTKESILETVSSGHINQSLAKAIAEVVSKRGLLDTSTFNPLRSADNPDEILRPTVGIHAALMRILQDPATGAKFFEKGFHPDLQIKTSYMEIFNELYGSRLARYLGIPSPRNTLGFRGGDILSPVILSEDFSKLGYETVLDRFGKESSLGLFGTDEALSNVFKAGYVLPEPEILRAQLAEDVGRLAGFVSLIKSVDTFQNEGNLIMSKVGARLGALDFGFAFDKSGPFPDLFSDPSHMLKLKHNFKMLMGKASFGRYSYDNEGNPLELLKDEEFLMNAYRGISRVAESLGTNSVYPIKKLIQLVLRDMTDARPDLDLRMPLELAEQMASLTKIFKDKAIGKFAGGGYIQKFHSLRGEVPGPYGTEVAGVLRAKTESVYPTDYVKSLQNATMSGGNTFVVNNDIKAAEGMDVNQLADVATRRTIQAIKELNSLANKSVGESRRRGSMIAS